MIFNLVCFVELCAVSFGVMAHAWLMANDDRYVRHQQERCKKDQERAASIGSPSHRDGDPAVRKPRERLSRVTRCFSRGPAKSLAVTFTSTTASAMEEADEEEADEEAACGTRPNGTAAPAPSPAVASSDHVGLSEPERAASRGVGIGHAARAPCSSALDRMKDGQTTSCRKRAAAKPTADEPPRPAPLDAQAIATDLGATRRERTWRRMMNLLDKDGDGDVSIWEICNCSPRTLKMLLKRPFLRTVAPLRFLDIYWRFLFPMVYVPYIVVKLGLVDGGARWEARAMSAASISGCFDA